MSIPSFIIRNWPTNTYNVGASLIYDKQLDSEFPDPTRATTGGMLVLYCTIQSKDLEEQIYIL